MHTYSVVSDSLATPWSRWTCQAPLSMGFPSQECWSGFPFPSPGIFPTKGSNPLFRVSCISRILYHGAIWEFTLSNALPKGFPGGLGVKASVCSAGDPGSIPGSGRSPGEGNGNPLQSSCLEKPVGGGAWWATYSPRGQSPTQLSDFTSPEEVIFKDTYFHHLNLALWT